MVFERNIILRVTDRGKTYEFDCHVEHMLTAKKSRSWLYFCDEYGRTGTSQCFAHSALTACLSLCEAVAVPE